MQAADDSPYLVLYENSFYLQFTSDFLINGMGFWIEYNVTAATKPPPSAPGAPPPPSGPWDSAAVGPQCSEAGLLVHDSGYYTSAAGAFVTSNMLQLMAGASIAADGTLAPIAIPPLPEVDPYIWMPMYAPSANCSWHFEMPPDATATLRFE